MRDVKTCNATTATYFGGGSLAMMALILDSGRGSRLGDLTEKQHKSMLKLDDGETIFGRQIRLLYEAGIRRFVVTTGPFEDQLKEVAEDYSLAGAEIQFIPNTRYLETNYIYSIWLARDCLDDDILLIHGDLVFDREYTNKVLDSPFRSLGSVNTSIALPEKDFKARVVDGRITAVSVDIFDDGCVAFQPYYKLSHDDMGVWLGEIEKYVQRGETAVYAESAGNNIFSSLSIAAFSYEGHLLEEIDTLDDYIRVSESARAFDAIQQKIVHGENIFDSPTRWKSLVGKSDRPLLVCGKSFDTLPLSNVLSKCFSGAIRFSEFSSNPLLQEIIKGCAAYRNNRCDSIIAIGGGSAIDVAKAIKGFVSSGDLDFRVRGGFGLRPMPLLAIPTTAGTGSESTSFAVYYDNGDKVSLDNGMLLPSAVILEPRLLASVPFYHKCATYFDALSQAIESCWSINSTSLSMKYAAQAIRILKRGFSAYFDLEPCDDVVLEVQIGANLAGKAINLSKTTAPHAMSYVLTGKYGFAHGHAVSLCLPRVWRTMLASKPEKCVDPRGYAHFCDAQRSIANCLGFDSVDASISWYEEAMDYLGLIRFVEDDNCDTEALTRSVNQERLRNSPIDFSAEDIQKLYCSIFEVRDK